MPSRRASPPLQPLAPIRFDVEEGFADTQQGGQAWRSYFMVDADKRLVVQVAKSRRQLDAELNTWKASSLSATLALTLLLSGVTWGIVRWSLRPIAAVSRNIEQRSELDLRPIPTQPLPIEMRPFAQAVNVLLRRLDTALQAERRFIADAAHELRTPLASLQAQAQLALAATPTQADRTALETLVEGIRRCARLSEQLLDMARLDTLEATPAQRHGPVQARGPDPGWQPVSLHEIVMLVTREFDTTAQQFRQRIVVNAEPCLIDGDIDALGILLRNLIDNALRYSGPGACVEVVCAVHAGTADDRQQAVISVRDSGPGIAPSERARVFDRFYRVKGTQVRGSGIGLSLVRRIADLHGASLTVTEGLDGKGVGFCIAFRYRGDLTLL